jgi:serine/threonine protein kinase
MAVHPTKASKTPAPDLSPPGPPLEPGDLFHGLRVESLVAQGGMGVVYRARKPGTDRDLALKILPPALAKEEEFRLRFDREARALAGLSHPNIVRLHDYGVEDDLMFLVMEFVDGVSLRQQLRERKISPPRALAVVLELCKALEFAHRERVIHRDVKPDNVLIDASGHVKLTDFGLALRIDAETARVTQTNYAVGTPHYMAPEQLERPEEIDHRVDIYSVGVVLYELLTRELPIGRFPLPSTRAPIDPAFDAVICRCLEKDPHDRYRNMAELRSALLAIPGAPRGADVPSPPPRPKISSNLEIRCACGWQFYIPAGAVAGVHCPSCGDRVDLGAGTRQAAGAAVAAPASPSRASLVKLGVAASILVVLVGVLVSVAFSPSPSRKPDQDPNISYRRAAAELPPPSSSSARTPEDKPPAARPVPAPRPRLPLAELRARLDSVVVESDMTGLVATILLNSGRPQDHDELHERLRALDRDVHDVLLQLEEQGHVVDPPDRFQSGDRLLSFAGKRMEPSRTIAFADDLRAWLRAFRPGVSAQVIVARKKQIVAYACTFPERTPELVAIAHQAGVTLGETPGYVAPPAEVLPPAAAPIPDSLLDGLRARLAALPQGYRDLLPYQDRGRADALLLARQGSAEDTGFLAGRFTELLRKAEDEQKQIETRRRELEARIADAAAQTDAVVCKDGRRIEGTLLEETETQVKVKARFGAVTISRDDVARIERGKGAAAEFRAAYAAAIGKKADLMRLVSFARDKKLSPQQELAALGVVALDPADERARADAGLPRSPYGASTEAEAAAAAGRIEYQGRTFTPDQFRQELKSLGYVQLNGVWCEKVSKVLKIDNLYRDEAKLPVIFKGAAVQSQTHTERDTVYDFRTKSWVPRTKTISDARYIGGGVCLIEIAAPGDLVEARVHARSQVAKTGGSVTVSAVVDPGEQIGKILYTLSAPGENDGSHDATEKVAGRSRFYVRAQVYGSGMFLVSDSNDLGVFEVKYVYGRPLERINALLTAAALGADSPATPDLKSNNDSVESGCRTVAAAAARLENLVDALLDVRRRTDTLYYAREYSLPDRYVELGAQIKDPLDPDWNNLTRDQALALGSWWGRLSGDDRRDFLGAYGLWCARCRYLRLPK